MNRPSLPALAGAAALVLVAGCAINPVTKKPELMLVSERQEKELGREADREIVAQYGVLEDGELPPRVEDVGQHLAAEGHRPDLGYTFRVLDDPLINAFALPGGYVYLTRGILPYLQSEAAMAGVLGHEIGHVTARHGANRLSKQILLGGAIGVAGLVSDVLADFGGLLGAGAQLLLLKYSRDQERQADQLGVAYATAEGYDTRDMAEFFRTLDRLAGEEQPPSWLSTHPDPGERYQTVLRLTEEEQQEVGRAEYVTRRRDYVERLDGLLFGPDPREGYVEGGWFDHPDLGFRFPVPRGWQVQNSRTQVLLVAPQEEALVVFGLEEARTPAAAADAFASQQGVQVRERSGPTIAGSKAVRLVSVAQGQEGQVGMVSTFATLDGQVYVFHGMTDPSSLQAQRAQLEAVADGLSELTDPEALARRPVRIAVVTADRTAPFRELVAPWPLPEDAPLDLAGLALLNGLQDPGTTVEEDTRLKVLVRGQSDSAGK